jgi:hypothetical protein
MYEFTLLISIEFTLSVFTVYVIHNRVSEWVELWADTQNWYPRIVFSLKYWQTPFVWPLACICYIKHTTRSVSIFEAGRVKCRGGGLKVKEDVGFTVTLKSTVLYIKNMYHDIGMRLLRYWDANQSFENKKLGCRSWSVRLCAFPFNSLRIVVKLYFFDISNSLFWECNSKGKQCWNFRTIYGGLGTE